MLLLGVDGGGTKTALCLVSRDGRLVASHRSPSCAYMGTNEGTALVARVMREAVAEVCRRARITADQVEHGFFALPGYGEIADDVAALDAIPREVLGHERYTCANDMVAGWAGSLGGVDGINIVSGTGSICYGEHAGRSVRVGGWGELFGDEGSGHWIGVRGLQLFSQMSDGRVPAGPLYGLMRDHLQVTADLEVIPLTLVTWRRNRGRVATLSRLVARAAESGDDRARSILVQGAAELAGAVTTARRLLGFADADLVPVSHSGGVFEIPVVTTEFVRLLTETSTAWDLREPLYPPEVGAAVLAARRAGSALSPEALARLHDEIAQGAGSRPPTATHGI